MNNLKIKNLKSGTDIRGVATLGDNDAEITLTDEAVKKIILGFCVWLKNFIKEIPTVAVGHDSRISSERIKSVVIDTLKQNGFKIYDCSLSSTPAMFMTTIDLNCNAAIEITASHHPFNKNGFKFFTKNGGLDSTDIDKILDYAENKNLHIKSNSGRVVKINYMNNYSSHLQDMIKKEVNSNNYDKPLSDFKIIVDAGNGVGGFYAYNVLKHLGADIVGSQFLNPDGRFPNHIPNPEDNEAIASIKKATLNAKADLGIIFDTDVDRAAVIDESGTEMNKNRLVAIAAYIALKSQPNGTIVTDSITSSGLKEFIENNLNAYQHCFKRGYKNVINEAKRLNSNGINCPLAIETSGHAAFRENYFLDDGAYLITKIIITMVNLKKNGKSLKSLISNLNEPAESLEFRIPFNFNNFKYESEKIIEHIKHFSKNRTDFELEENNFEGIRVNFYDELKNKIGWFLVRSSVHDPILVINVESDKKGFANAILNDILNCINYKHKINN